MNDISELKEAYQNAKSLGKEARLTFLNNILDYCLLIKFDKHKTTMMLAVIRNFLPQPGQKFTECDAERDEVDIEINEKIEETFKNATIRFERFERLSGD